MTGGRFPRYSCFTSKFNILVGNLKQQHAAEVTGKLTEQLFVFRFP